VLSRGAAAQIRTIGQFDLCVRIILVDDDEPTLYERPLKLIGDRVVSSIAVGIDKNEVGITEKQKKKKGSR